MMKRGPSLNLVSSGQLAVGGVCMDSSSRAGVYIVHLEELRVCLRTRKQASVDGREGCDRVFET